MIASRLSSIQNISVLLIEAGNVFGPLSIIPLLTTFQQNTSVDWAFRTVSQKYSSAGFTDQQQLLPRGKGLGGSSQLNYMLHYVNDIEKEFDTWEAFGGSEWGRSNLMKYLSDFNDFRFESELTSVVDSGVELSRVFRKMKIELDEALYESEEEDIDFRLAKYHTKNGIRWSVYHKYLRPTFRNKNLKILYNTRVRKVGMSMSTKHFNLRIKIFQSNFHADSYHGKPSINRSHFTGK